MEVKETSFPDPGDRGPRTERGREEAEADGSPLMCFQLLRSVWDRLTEDARDGRVLAPPLLT